MADDSTKRDYLDEHLPYMLKMVRFTYGRIQQEPCYLAWNAYFESFCVNARNLVVFLTNGDDGRNNFKASEFADGFRARLGDLSGPNQELNKQVFHLDKKRPAQSSGKFDTADAKKVLDWIEENFAAFLGRLPPDLQELFNVNKAEVRVPEAMRARTLNMSTSTTTASESVSVIQIPTTTTAPSEAYTFDYPSDVRRPPSQ